MTTRPPYPFASSNRGGGGGVMSDVSTPMTFLGNLTTMFLVATDNVTSLDLFDDDIINGSNVTSTTAYGNITEAPPMELPHPIWVTVLIGLLAGIIMIVTVLGNITVVLAFGLERTIRQPTNYFLASLAVSDLLIGTFSMPLYTQYLLFGVWPLGQWLCDLWLSLDWTVCLTSQYTVFLITMDRFLSVKIPAKYRNWRTERKVMIMISITWILPTLVFFTSIIGWQFFVGERTVAEGTCEVQFMSDAMFTFVLTIGYFWITLFVIGILYAGIYKVALDLQRKSDAKHKKLQSTMELAGDGPNHNDRGNAIGCGEGGSNNNSSGGDSNTPHKNKSNSKGKGNNRKSVRAALPCPLAAQAVNTTSFSTNKSAEKDDDRSSSPAFASDDENSSSGGACGAPKSPLSSGVYIGRPNPAAGIVNSALFANTGGLVRSLHGDLFFGAQVDTKEVSTIPPRAPPPPYSEFAGVRSNNIIGSDGSDMEGTVNGKRLDDVDDNNTYSSYSDRLEKQTTPLLQEEIKKGSRYIDEKSFLENIKSDSATLLQDVSKFGSEVEDSDVNNAARIASSPIWKRRHSLPLEACDDDYYLDDEVSTFISGDPTTTHTTVNDTPPETKKHEINNDNQCGNVDSDNNGDDAYKQQQLQQENNVFTNKASVVSFENSNMSADFSSKPTTNNNATGNNVASSISGDHQLQNQQNQQNQQPQLCSNINNNSNTTNNNTPIALTAAAGVAGATPTAPPSDTNEESSRSDTHCLSAAHRRGRNNNDTRLHTFVKSVRSRNSRKRNRRERKSKSENRARKALRTITIILGAFVLCWTPYHISVMVMALCKDCINVYVYSFTYWMCYLNSPINPFCYAFANTQFKRTFLRIMKFDWHRT